MFETEFNRLLLLAASPLDQSRLIALRALVINHLLQSDTRATLAASGCSTAAAAACLRHCSSVTHGIGTVTDIPI